MLNVTPNSFLFSVMRGKHHSPSCAPLSSSNANSTCFCNNKSSNGTSLNFPLASVLLGSTDGYGLFKGSDESNLAVESPCANSIDLGLIDAAHDVEHARNDTIKMAAMMSDEGLVFWHDYGGKGSLRPLAEYLEALGRRFPVYRVPETALAWTKAKDLKRASL